MLPKTLRHVANRSVGKFSFFNPSRGLHSTQFSARSLRQYEEPSKRRSFIASAAIAAACLGIAAVNQPSKASADPETQPQLSLFTWGNGFFGQLGHGKEENEFLPRVVSHLGPLGASPVQVSCGGGVTAVVCEDGRLFSWGSGDMRDGFSNQSLPEQVSLPAANDKAVYVSVGGNHGAVISQNGSLYTWGKSNLFGQLGHQVRTPPGVLSQVATTDNAKFAQVSCGNNHTAAVDTNGRLFVWGGGRDGALGLGDKADKKLPVLLEGAFNGKRVTQVSCGRESTLVLVDDGSVWSFGSDDLGQLGCGAVSRYQREPIQVATLAQENVVAISNGEFHAACITEKGELFTWGSGRDGQLGHGNRDDVSMPKRVNELVGKRVASVHCGGGHTAVVTDNGHIYCFGRGRDGQLSRSKAAESVASYRTLPQKIELFESEKLRVVDADCGSDHTAAIVTSA